MAEKKKSEPARDMGPRILVVLDAGADGARAMELACLAGREAHAVIHVAGAVVERAVQQARLFHMRVVTEDGAVASSTGATLRLVRRLRPRTLVLAVPRPGSGWSAVRRQWELWRLQRKAGCEVVVVRA